MRLLAPIHALPNAEPPGLAESVQPLWRGDRGIDRNGLGDGRRSSVIVKHARFPAAFDQAHPRGRAGRRSDRHQRRACEMKTHWCRHRGTGCDADRRDPARLAIERHEEVPVPLEDWGASGFPGRPQRRLELASRTAEQAWHPMYAVAWTDFSRCLNGWSPRHSTGPADSACLTREMLQGMRQ